MLTVRDLREGPATEEPPRTSAQNEEGDIFLVGLYLACQCEFPLRRGVRPVAELSIHRSFRFGPCRGNELAGGRRGGEEDRSAGRKDASAEDSKVRAVQEPRRHLLPERTQEALPVAGVSVPELPAGRQAAAGDGGASRSSQVTTARDGCVRRRSNAITTAPSRYQRQESGASTVQYIEELLTHKRTYQKHLKRLQRDNATEGVVRSECAIDFSFRFFSFRRSL